MREGFTPAMQVRGHSRSPRQQTPTDTKKSPKKRAPASQNTHVSWVGTYSKQWHEFFFVYLVQDKDLDVVHVHRGGVGEVVHHATRGADNDVRPRPQLRFLPQEEGVGVVVVVDHVGVARYVKNEWILLGLRVVAATDISSI